MKLLAGRINRTTYLLVVLVGVLVALVFERPDVSRYFDAHHPAFAAVGFGILLPLLIWQFAMGARRLHDLNQSGWLALLLTLPGVQLVLLLLPGNRTDNRYGKRPEAYFDLAALLPRQPTEPSDYK